MLETLMTGENFAALITLVTMEVILGIDNLIFIAIVTNKLPEQQRKSARRIGISLALIMRLALLSIIAWIAGLTEPVFDLGIIGPSDEHGKPLFETAFSWRDLILIAGGIFLIWKATSEIHQKVDPKSGDSVFHTRKTPVSYAAVITQIILLDIVFSFDSILTAIGMTDHLPIMVIAVIIAVLTMLLAADPLANFINRNPTVVMLALAFLLLIGTLLIADGMGHHIPKGYVYTAMAFAIFVEFLNMLNRRAARKETK